MSKLQLGNDFDDEGGSDSSINEEGVKKIEGEETDDQEESDDSADSPDSKKVDGEETDDSEDGQEGSDADESYEDDKGKGQPDKKQVLQGLLDTEKELDGDEAELEAQIAAARQRITDKRRARREKRDIVETIDTKFPETEEEETDDLSDVDPDTIKLLERFTKAKGLVPKAELEKQTYQQIHKSAEEAFYASHPEYLPENDPNDELYKALRTELSLFAPPKEAKLIPAMFERAHKLVLQQHPDKFRKTEKKDTEDKKIENDTRKVVRIKNQGLGGGNTGSGKGGNADDSSKGKKQFSADQISALRSGGWTDEEIKELTGN